MNQKRIDYVNKIAWFIILIGGGILGLMIWLIFLDGNPPIVIDVPVAVDKDQYYQGDEIIMSVYFCRKVDAPAVVYPAYVGENILYPLDPVTTTYGKGCRLSAIHSTIPLDLPPGIYRRETTAVYHVNNLVDRTATWYTEDFEVLPRK